MGMAFSQDAVWKRRGPNEDIAQLDADKATFRKGIGNYVRNNGNCSVSGSGGVQHFRTAIIAEVRFLKAASEFTNILQTAATRENRRQTPLLARCTEFFSLTGH